MSNQEPLRFVAADSGLFTWSMKKSDKTWYDHSTRGVDGQFLACKVKWFSSLQVFCLRQLHEYSPFRLNLCAHIVGRKDWQLLLPSTAYMHLGFS